MTPLGLLLRASARDPVLAARLRPVIWMLLLAHLLASAPQRGGPAPRGRFAAALARLDQLELGVADVQPPADPALLGERGRVEAQVQVGAEAARVDRPVELALERGAARLDGDEQRVGDVRHEREV